MAQRIRNFTSEVNETESPILAAICEVMAQYSMTFEELYHAWSKLKTIHDSKPIFTTITATDLLPPLLTSAAEAG